MPMPEPRKDEDHDEFMERCMDDDIMRRDFPEREQRLAVCQSQWERGQEEDVVGRMLNDQAVREFLAERERQREHLMRNAARLEPVPAERFRIENAASDKAEMWLYDEIGWFGVTAGDFAAALRSVKAKEITLHINSPGGDVFDGLAMMNSLRSHPATVTARVDGLGASAATAVMLGADRIVMAKGAMLMIHEPSGITLGDAADHRKTAEVLDAIGDDLASLYKERGDSRVNWRQKMRDETWFNGEQAVKAGLADEIDEATPAVENTFDLSIYAHVPAELGGTAPTMETAMNQADAQQAPSFTFNFNSTITPEQARQLMNIAPPEPQPNPNPAPSAEPAATSQEPNGATDQEPVLSPASAELLLALGEVEAEAVMIG